MKVLKYLLPVSIVLVALFVVSILPAKGAAPVGNYLVLNGGYVKSSNSDVSAPSGFSFEAWIRPSNTSGIQPIFTARNNIGGADSYNYLVGLNGGSLAFNYTYGSGSRVLITAGNIPSEVWTHIAVTLSSTNARLFINGQQVFNNNTSVSGFHSIGPDNYLGTSFVSADQAVFSINSSFDNPFRSGFGIQADGGTFIGDIDEVRVSSAARDISGLWTSGTYNSQLTTDNPTILLWHLDEVRGADSAHDSSGHARDGVLTGDDSQIHFFGILPTPTPWTYSLPTFGRTRWVLPTLSIPNLNPQPTTASSPTTPVPQPTANPDDIRGGWERPIRPSFR